MLTSWRQIYIKHDTQKNKTLHAKHIILEFSFIARVSSLQCSQSESSIVGLAAWGKQHCHSSMGMEVFGQWHQDSNIRQQHLDGGIVTAE